MNGMASTVPDEEVLLLDRLRRHEDAACEELVRTQGGRLLAVARRMLRNDEDARDVVQEGFISAFRAIPNFNGQCRLSTWLHRIVVNAALMKIRTRTRKPEESIDDLLPRYLEDGHHADPTSDWGAPANELLEQQQVRAQVRAGIDRLPESYRTVLLCGTSKRWTRRRRRACWASRRTPSRSGFTVRVKRSRRSSSRR